MKTTSIEKTVLGVIGAFILLMAVSVTYMMSWVEDAGGVKAVIISVGKEIKDIGEKINKNN